MSAVWHWFRNADLDIRAWGWDHPVLAVLVMVAALGLAVLANKILDR